MVKFNVRILACVASVSVRFRSKERGTRVKDNTKNGASKRAARGWGRKEGNACWQTPSFPCPSPLFHFLTLVPFFARPKPKLPFFVVPRSFFHGPQPHGNACYAGYKNSDMEVELKKQQRSLNGLDVAREGLDNLPFINRGDILTETILNLWTSLQLLE